MRRQGDHSNSRRIPLSCKSTIANKRQLHARVRGIKEKKKQKKKWLTAECEGTFYDNAGAVLLSAFENCFVFQHSFLPPSASSVRRRSLREPLAGDGDDGTGWIFNRFVLGSTMGGGIVVNIITYRSLQLYFPRPCQTGAITHSSHPRCTDAAPTTHTHTHTHSTNLHISGIANMAVSSLRHLTKYVSYEAFNLLFRHDLAFQFPHLHETIIPAGTDLGVMYPPNP